MELVMVYFENEENCERT